VEELCWWRKKAFTRAISLFQPDLSLLRNKIFTPSDLGDDDRMGSIDLWACEAMARDDCVATREQSYQAALLSDLVRDGWDLDSRTIRLEDSENVQGFCAPPVLPLMVSKALDISFLEPISTIKDPLARMIAKGVNQKCMIRMCDEKSLSVFEGSEEIMVTVRLWTLCSLLGNYSHARPSSRPDIQGRKILYDWLWGYEAGRDVVPEKYTQKPKKKLTKEEKKKRRAELEVAPLSPFIRLQVLCPHFVLFCCREQLVYLLDDIPALRRHFDTFSNFAQYRDIVVDCMDEIRHWFASHLKLPCSPLHAFLRGEGIGSYHEKEFFQVVRDILLCYHTRLGEMNYKRPNSNVMSVIRSLKSTKKKDAIPMVQMPGWVAPAEVNPLGEEDDEEDEEDQKVATAFDFSPYLPASHIKAVGEMIDSLLKKSLTPSQVFYCCLDIFAACGLSTEQVQLVKSVIKGLQAGKVSKKQYEGQFRVLKRLLPHGYNLIQAAAELLREKQRVRVICTLPLDITQRQLQAARDRFGCKDGEYISDSLSFYFCPICDCIYSLLRDFNASFANNYKYGLRDAAVDYTTRLPYCRRGKKNHRGECGAQPLACIPLAGILLFYCNKRVMICPQPGCGMPMVLDPKQSIYNSASAACFDCTHKATHRRVDYGLDFLTKCAKCDVSVPNPEKMFLYFKNVMMCNRCHKSYPALKNHLHDPAVRSRCRDRESVIKEIVGYCRERKKQREDKLRPSWNRAAKRSRRASRSKGRK
jgi:hypothetical protein